MSRVQIKLPQDYVFSTQIAVQIGDINYGGHLANDAVLRLCHEARLQFLQHFDYSETDIEGCGLIMADTAIRFVNQAYHGDVLIFEMAVEDIGRAGFALITKISDAEKQHDVAHVKNGMVFFNYDTQSIATTPKEFIHHFQSKENIQTYDQNSPQSCMQVISMLMLADGDLDIEELEEESIQKICTLLQVNRTDFFAVLRQYAKDAHLWGKNINHAEHSDELNIKNINLIVDKIDDHTLQVKVLAIALSVCRGDYSLNAPERVLFRHVLNRWNINPDDVLTPSTQEA